MTRALPIREADIQRAIIEWLSWKRIFHYRQNSGAFTTERGHFLRFGVPGAPDIVAVVEGVYWGVEVKAPGGRLSPDQQTFREALTKAGGVYTVAYSVDDVARVLSSINRNAA